MEVAWSSNLVHMFPVTIVTYIAIMRSRGQRPRSPDLTKLGHEMRHEQMTTKPSNLVTVLFKGITIYCHVHIIFCNSTLFYVEIGEQKSKIRRFNYLNQIFRLVEKEKKYAKIKT